MSTTQKNAQGIVQFDAALGDALAPAGVVVPFSTSTGNLSVGANGDFEIAAGVVTINRPGWYKAKASIPLTGSALDDASVEMQLGIGPGSVIGIQGQGINVADKDEVCIVEQLFELTPDLINGVANNLQIVAAGAATTSIDNVANAGAAKLLIEKLK